MNDVRAFSRIVLALTFGIMLAGCQSTASIARDHVHKAKASFAGKKGTAAARARAAERADPPRVEFPELTCAKYGKPFGNDAKLTASRVRKGDPYYIEFRYRFSYAIASGHMYDVFGRLDADGNPVTRQYIGAFPEGGILGLYGGAVVPVPSEMHPSSRDCNYTPGAAYRVSLTAAQYAALLAKVREALAHPPLWHMAFNNCNRFAAGLGSVAGLRLPDNQLLPSFAYIHAFIRANGDKEISG